MKTYFERVQAITNAIDALNDYRVDLQYIANACNTGSRAQHTAFGDLMKAEQTIEVLSEVRAYFRGVCEPDMTRANPCEQCSHECSPAKYCPLDG